MHHPPPPPMKKGKLNLPYLSLGILWEFHLRFHGMFDQLDHVVVHVVSGVLAGLTQVVVRTDQASEAGPRHCLLTLITDQLLYLGSLW